MTADGTYRSARAGETITTADRLDGLPVDSLVRAGGEVYERIKPDARVNGGVETWRCLHEPRDDYGWRTYPADTVLWQGTPVTVLFRPDAPQPATAEPPLTDAEYRAMQEDRDRWRAIAEARTADLRDARRARREGTPDPGDLTAPHPAATDDVVERAAVALCHATHTLGTCNRMEDHRAGVRAALAAAGAGAEVDREALRSALAPALQAVEEEAARYGVSAGIGALSDAAADAVLAVLAARGDAATPTEVEWGVRYPAFGVVAGHVAQTDGYGKTHTEDTARAVVAREGDNGTVVQRTVSAWREVS